MSNHSNILQGSVEDVINVKKFNLYYHNLKPQTSRYLIHFTFFAEVWVSTILQWSCNVMYFFGDLKDAEGDKITGKNQTLEMISQGRVMKWDDVQCIERCCDAKSWNALHLTWACESLNVNILVSWFCCIKYMFNVFKAVLFDLLSYLCPYKKRVASPEPAFILFLKYCFGW